MAVTNGIIAARHVKLSIEVDHKHSYTVCVRNMKVIQKVSSDGLLRKKQEYITNHIYCHL